MAKQQSELKAGDEVAIIPWSNHGVRYHMGYKVKKVTPSGQVIVQHATREDYERRFDKFGYEMGTHSTKWHKDQLEPDVEKARSVTALKDRQRNAAVALVAIREFEVRDTYSKESMQALVAELEIKLATAKALVEAI